MGRPKRDELALLRAADLLQGQDEQELAFTTSYLAQVCLPYRDPGDIPVWQRRNGDVLMTVRPGYTDDPATGKPVSLRYPSGAIPRALMFYIITEARRTKSPYIVLGDGVVDFFRQLNPDGRVTGGKTGSLTRMRDQTNRFLHAAIDVQRRRVGADGEQTLLTTNMTVAKNVLLWGDGENDRAVVQLSADFFSEIMESGVPLDLGALRLFGDDAWCIDLYTFLSWRFYSLQRKITIPFADLNNQFGTLRALETKEQRYKFRKSIESKLTRVLAVYRDANAELTPHGLVLSPSKTHVRFKGLRALEREVAASQPPLDARIGFDRGPGRANSAPLLGLRRTRAQLAPKWRSDDPAPSVGDLDNSGHLNATSVG